MVRGIMVQLAFHAHPRRKDTREGQPADAFVEIRTPVSTGESVAKAFRDTGIRP
jgi:hypothetical protein